MADFVIDKSYPKVDTSNPMYADGRTVRFEIQTEKPLSEEFDNDLRKLIEKHQIR